MVENLDPEEEKRIEDAARYTSSDYDTFRREYEEFNELFEGYIENLKIKHMEFISIKNNWINLLDSSDREKYFNKEVVKAKKRYLERINKFTDVKEKTILRMSAGYFDTRLEVMPELKIELETDAWNHACKGTFFEWLVILLTIINFGEYEPSERGITIDSKKPLKIRSDARGCNYLWYQKTLKFEQGLSAKPDLLITNSSEEPNLNSIIGIIECKSKTKIGSKDIRDIFTKGWDLLPNFVFLLSFAELDQELKTNLEEHYGMDVYSGFDVDRMKDELGYKETLERVMVSKRFRDRIHHRFDEKYC